MANEAIRRSIEIHNKGSVSTNAPKEKKECTGCTYWEEKYYAQKRQTQALIESLQGIEAGSRDAIKKATTEG